MSVRKNQFFIHIQALPLLFIFSTGISFAQSNLSQLADLKEEAEQSELESQVKQGAIGIHLLSSLAERKSFTPSSCQIDASTKTKSAKKAAWKAGQTQLILMVEIAPLVKRKVYTPYSDLSIDYVMPDLVTGKMTAISTLAPDNTLFSDGGFSFKTFESKLTRSNSSFTQFLTDYPPVSGQPYSVAQDQSAQYVMKYGNFVKLLVPTVAAYWTNNPDQLKKNEALVTDEIATLIKKHFPTAEEQQNVLSLLADQMYATYNESKNPRGNNSSNNPDHKPIPKGNIGIVQMFYATEIENEYQGGVCTDIANAIGRIAKKLDPSKDVYSIEESGFGGSSHFATLISDGKKATVIAGEGPTTYDISNG